MPICYYRAIGIIITMKVELRDYRRDGAVVVNLDRQTEPNDFDLAWLERVGEVACIVGLAALALMAMAVI